MNTLDAEIFAVGKWNGMTFTADDLSAMVAAFDSLCNNHRVPLKFGHNNEQPMTDGFPALGWVEKVWVAGDKLMAKFVDMPDIVFGAIKKKLYKSVSVELDMDVKYKATEYPFVLSGVALLGADIPAVNTLKDLTHFLSRDANFSVGRRAAFSAIAGITNPKEKQMTLEELTAKVAELSASTATFSTDNAKLKAENADLVAKVAKFEADAKAKADSDVAAAIVAKRTEVSTLLENGVKSEAITPAQREQFSKLMRVDDDIAVMALDIEEVKKLTTNGKKQFNREQGRNEKDGNITLTAPEQVVAECHALIAEGKAKDFTTAQAIVFARNPKLAREYVDFNEEE